MILKEANFKDWELLLKWRNETESRLNSINSAVVTEEKHKEWLRRSIVDQDRKLYIAFENTVPVGTVRADFVKEEKVHTLSWTVAPNHRGKGFGKKMVRLLVNSLEGKVQAVIKDGNIASIKIAESAGLTFLEKKGEILYYQNKK